MLYDQDTQGRGIRGRFLFFFYPKPSSVGWEQATWQGPAEVLSKDERGRRECLGNSIGESEQRRQGPGGWI